MKRLCIALMVIGMLVVATAQADVIVSYQFNGSSGAATTVDPNATAGAFTISAGALSYYSASGSSTWLSAPPAATEGGGGWTATDFASAKNFSFTITPLAGYAISISGLNVIINGSSGAAVTLGWGIDSTLESSWTRPNTVFNAVTSTLGAPTTATTASQTIRIAGWAGTSTTGGGNVRVDNVVLNGTVSLIPEPGVISLLGLGLAVLFSVRRKFS